MTTSAKTETLSWSCEQGIIELELHRAPANEIGSQTLEDLEGFVKALDELKTDAAALIIHSSIAAGFCAGADLRELYHTGKTMGEHDRITGVRDFLNRIHAVLNAIDEAHLPALNPHDATAALCPTAGCTEARATDTVMRYGEDEFVILQSEVDRPSSVARLSKRIVDAIRQPFDIQNFRVTISASIGLALIPRDGSDPQELLNVARANLQKGRAEADETVTVNDSANAVFGI